MKHQPQKFDTSPRDLFEQIISLVAYTTNNKFLKFIIHFLSRKEVMLDLIQEVKAKFQPQIFDKK